MVEKNSRCYHELIQLKTYQERFDYLWIGDMNISSPRAISNPFYRSKSWLQFRPEIIIRDFGCDLGIRDLEIEQIPGKPTILVHHINPITIKDLENHNIDKLLNPENCVTTSYLTHNKIHYLKNKSVEFIERREGDTKLW